jgi:CBS domain-containing protein
MTYEHAHRQVPAEDPVSSLMSWPVVSVEITDSLVDVSRALAADEIGAVLVLHNDVLVGVVSERDIAGQVGAEVDPEELTAGDVMSADPVTVTPDAPVLEAARVMHAAQVRHLPVVSDGLIVGILSIRDVFDVLLGHAETRASDAPPVPQVEATWRYHQQAVWLRTCPICGREAHPSSP